MAIERMWRLRQLLRTWLRGNNWDFGVYLLAITIDDDSTGAIGYTAREFYRQCRFAARCRSTNNNYLFHEGENTLMQHEPQRENVVTILANPDVTPLKAQEIDSVVDALQGHGAYVEDVVVLSENRAVDVYFNGLNLPDVRELLTHLLAEVPFDFAVQKEWARKKKFLISDMDSTMIEQECIDEIADFVGKKAEVADITERAMQGELAFEDSLRARIGLLNGLPKSTLEQAFNERITHTSGARELLATMKAHGATCVLVSGGFTFFAERIASQLGFDAAEANILEFDENDALTSVAEPILGRAAKQVTLEHYVQELGIKLADTIAVGDGANDLDMITASAGGYGLGCAFHAKPAVNAAALESGGIALETCDLRGLLYIQGYKDDEIVQDI